MHPCIYVVGICHFCERQPAEKARISLVFDQAKRPMRCGLTGVGWIAFLVFLLEEARDTGRVSQNQAWYRRWRRFRLLFFSFLFSGGKQPWTRRGKKRLFFSSDAIPPTREPSPSAYWASFSLLPLSGGVCRGGEEGDGVPQGRNKDIRRQDRRDDDGVSGTGV